MLASRCVQVPVRVNIIYYDVDLNKRAAVVYSGNDSSSNSFHIKTSETTKRQDRRIFFNTLSWLGQSPVATSPRKPLRYVDILSSNPSHLQLTSI